MFKYYDTEKPVETFYEQTTMLEMNQMGVLAAITDHFSAIRSCMKIKERLMKERPVRGPH